MASASRDSRGRRRGGRAGSDNASAIPVTQDEIAYEVAIQDDFLAGMPPYVSPQVDTILGYAPGEFLRAPTLWVHLLHPDDVAGVRELTLRLAEDLVPRIRRYRLVIVSVGAHMPSRHRHHSLLAGRTLAPTPPRSA